MPGLTGHRIMNSFAELDYAIPVFTGMTFTWLSIYLNSDKARAGTYTFKSYTKLHALARPAQNYLIAKQ
jgi:hypothetical protein